MDGKGCLKIFAVTMMEYGQGQYLCLHSRCIMLVVCSISSMHMAFSSWNIMVSYCKIAWRLSNFGRSLDNKCNLSLIRLRADLAEPPDETVLNSASTQIPYHLPVTYNCQGLQWPTVSDSLHCQWLTATVGNKRFVLQFLVCCCHAMPHDSNVIKDYRTPV